MLYYLLILMCCSGIIGSIIDGVTVNRDQRYITLNPADTRERVSMVSVATVDDIRHAFDSAYEAFNKWGRLSPFAP